MQEQYKKIYQPALELLKKIMQKAGTFEKDKIIEPDETNLCNQLSKLYSFLNGESLKQTRYMVSEIKCILIFNYWSDISKECWSLLYGGMKMLAEPEKIKRESNHTFRRKCLEERVSLLPTTRKVREIVCL